MQVIQYDVLVCAEAYIPFADIRFMKGKLFLFGFRAGVKLHTNANFCRGGCFIVHPRTSLDIPVPQRNCEVKNRFR